MSYKQLNPEERNRLFLLRSSTDLSLGEIADLMGRNRSTLSRELRRNVSNAGVYLPDTAQALCQERRKKAKPRFAKISSTCLTEIKRRLKKYHSPEQIAGRLKQEQLEYVSHETIYQLIYQDHEGMQAYCKYLRQSHKNRNIRLSVKSNRGKIANRVGIEERPPIVDEKVQIGHWESDTVIGANHAGGLVTCVDKASRYLLAEVIPDKTAGSVNTATEKMFKQVPAEKRKTVTSDNGKEFSGHVKLAMLLKIAWYFARPHRPWERGLNEHTNGLLRQFFPKSTNFKTVKSESLQKAVDLINHRPRKCLDYKTPHEVYFEQSGAVALQI